MFDFVGPAFLWFASVGFSIWHMARTGKEPQLDSLGDSFSGLWPDRINCCCGHANACRGCL